MFVVAAKTHVFWPTTYAYCPKTRASWATTQASWPVVAAETNIFSSMFGRTDLIIGASKAKNREEFDFDVHLPAETQKLVQTSKKCCPTLKNFVDKNFCRPKIELTGIV